MNYEFKFTFRVMHATTLVNKDHPMLLGNCNAKPFIIIKALIICGLSLRGRRLTIGHQVCDKAE